MTTADRRRTLRDCLDLIADDPDAGRVALGAILLDLGPVLADADADEREAVMDWLAVAGKPCGRPDCRAQVYPWRPSFGPDNAYCSPECAGVDARFLQLITSGAPLAECFEACEVAE